MPQGNEEQKYNQTQDWRWDELLDPVGFLVLFQTVIGYAVTRCAQLVRISSATFEVLAEIFNITKSIIVSRMFWGRGNLYKNSFHYLISFLTGFALVTGIVSQVGIGTSTQALQVTYGQSTTDDLLQQGGGIQAALPVDANRPDLALQIYVVEDGDSLAGIAQQFNVSVDTVRWANLGRISPFNNEILAGWELKIPEIDGVLYKTRPGQTVDDVAAITGGTKFDIIEINELVPPEYKLPAEVFVPKGTLSESEVVITGIPQGVFSNPLSHPSCAGYRFERGLSSYHNGTDLSKRGGCPVRAIGAGRVTYVGWSPGAGFNVKIDHGGDITSHYYHSTGEFWVKVGDRVQQGQEIMMMGSTGNSTGTHLHLSLFKNKVAVNPGIFVPY